MQKAGTNARDASFANPRAAVHGDQSSVGASGFAVTAPSLSLPKGGGAIRGMGEKFAANPVTGTGSLTVPIATSPGRSGFGPQLSLAYDSGSGNGPFGFGWSLSVPAITRKTDKGLPRYQDADASDEFILSGAEDLVPVPTADGDEPKPDPLGGGSYWVQRYRPRIEGLFARIERWTNTANPADTCWRSISRDNVTTWYGRTESSRIRDPCDPQQVFSWLICASYDDKGNAIVYEYAAENDDKVDRGQANERNRVRTANRYLKRIKYGNRTPNRDPTTWKAIAPAGLPNETWMFEVVFDYDEGHYQEGDLDPAPDQHRFVQASALPDLPWDEQVRGWPVRQDPFSSYRAGFEVRTYRLCRRVLMFHHIPDLSTGEQGYDGLVRSTEFEYAESRIASFITSVTQSGYVRQPADSMPDRYLKKSLPPLEFAYSRVPGPEEIAQQPIREVDADSLDNLPHGLDGSEYQWVDLDGEGISGVLTEQTDCWYYKRNLSPTNRVRDDRGEHTEARFGVLEAVAAKPASALAGGRGQFMDLAGDGQLDLVQLDGPVRGFYERTGEAGWETFRPFASWPNLNTRDPYLRFVDMTGDGHADMLITEDQALTWYPSLAETGFGPAERTWQPGDEEQGPRLVFADGTQSIYLADLSGDGLSDLVRIRNGQVCYWPNLGYGRFGAKVTMDNAPWFDTPDQFDQRRIRLADIDGSGTTDIIYLHGDGVRIYYNQSGNGWSDAVPVPQFPAVDNVSSIQALDLLAEGTACLVWSSPLPAAKGQPMRYIDLMGGQKPHLLTSVKNNLGAETHIQYAPSTYFYLKDQRDGRPWITRLPFPVHVVERVETHDRISRNRFVTRYAYHHGYFDGVEREFRGFGMVEQRDTEEFAAFEAHGMLADATNLDAASHVPPVVTKTWFHTGALGEGDRISRHFESEYYREGDISRGEVLLDDTILPTGLTPDESREACRALKGSILRQEIYACDGTEQADRPYSASERNYTIELLQPRGANEHAVFFVHPRETTDFHYERKLVEVNGRMRADPRVSHAMTLKVDSYGNVERAVAIAYRRRAVPELQTPEQTDTHITFTVSRFANADEQEEWYRVGVPVETRTYEVVKPPDPILTQDLVAPFKFEPLRTLTETLFPLDQAEPGEAATWPYEKWNWRRDATQAPAEARLRLIEHVRTLYRCDDLTGPLALGKIESLALPFESYKLAFTPGLLSQVYRRPLDIVQPPGAPEPENLLPDPHAVLPVDAATNRAADRGGYVDLENNGNWWIPSGRVFYSPGPADTPFDELEHAKAHFFLPHRYRDPFHTEAVSTESFVAYDGHSLLMLETRDALGNRVTVGERLPNGDGEQSRPGNDYRVLQPRAVMDPNRNRTAVAFDALGMVVGTAVMGKPPPAPREGDSLDGFEADLTPAVILDHLANPRADPHALLRHASTRLVYDLFAFYHSQDQAEPQPAVVWTLARETHDAALKSGERTKVQHSFSYSDGFGREIQKKIQAEPGEVEVEDAAGNVSTVDSAPNVRWVGSGWTIFNNKGKPVRQYEPFFSLDHRFQFGKKVGVSPVLFYDPAERVVATLHPNHSYEKVVFDPWQQTTYDVNDTVAPRSTQTGDPRTDPDICGYVEKYFDGLAADPGQPWQTWYEQRIGGSLGPDEMAAARKAGAHADTPTTVHFDTLGRPVLTVTHNRVVCAGHPLDGTDDHFATRVELDIEGNQRTVIDALGRIVMRYDYDLLSNHIHQASMEAGERWMLNDVSGKPLSAWDGRNHRFRTAYDPLRRPTDSYLRDGVGEPLLVGRTVYGETQSNPEANNLRGKVVQVLDQAGVVTSGEYDFKGNLLRSQRQLAQEYKAMVNWSAAVPLEPDLYVSRTRYDALNRPTELTSPDNSVIRHGYNEANLLERVDANLRGATDDAGQPVWTSFVTDIDYNAKGQRTLIDYGNGVRTTYEYDPLTFRLARLLSIRGNKTASDCAPLLEPRTCEDPPAICSRLLTNRCAVQNLQYTYDPAGNITYIRDDAQQTIYFRNRRVEPSADYTYDAIYRLIEATGREHLGQTGGVLNPPTPHSYNDAPRVGLPHPGDGIAMGTYRERYVYDAVGNFREMQHRVVGPAPPLPANPEWTRTYTYSEPSLLEPANQSNRLTSTTIDGMTETYSTGGDGYDTHGNMLRIAHLPAMQWDFRDQLRVTQRQLINGDGSDDAAPQVERTWYVYDSAGQRVGKVTEAADGTKKHERTYLGAFEVYREYGTTGSVTLSRETLHVMEDKQRIALVDTKTTSDASEISDSKSLVRYQLSNHLGSASLELDADGRIISYEEYTPYGSTSYQAVRNQTETPNRYRYTGMERDEESGLYYHGARYYSPWLGRWTSADPLGLLDSLDLYIYVGNEPLRRIDPSGNEDIPSRYEPTGMAGNFGLTIRFDEITGKVEKPQLNLNPLLTSPLASDPSTEWLPLGASGLYFRKSVAVLPNPPAPQEERSFWSRGGKTLAVGLGLLALGALAVATGGCAFVLTMGAMSLSAGIAGTSLGAAQLGLSYSGHTTAAQDKQVTEAAADMMLCTSGPLAAVGCSVGASAGGSRESMRTGGLVGGLAEGVAAIGMGLYKMRPGPGSFPEPSAEVSVDVWQMMNNEQRAAYEIGQLTLRDSAYVELQLLSPIERGRALMSRGAWETLKLVNPLNLTKTWSTGLTPGARLVAPYLIQGMRLITSPLLFLNTLDSGTTSVLDKGN